MKMAYQDAFPLKKIFLKIIPKGDERKCVNACLFMFKMTA